MIEMTTASAPGKLVLLGEHASRHGKPILVQAVDHRIFAVLKPRKDNKIFLSSPDLKISGEKYPSDRLDMVSAAIRKFFEKTGEEGGFDLETKSSVTAGMGSSGASIVSTIGALDGFFGTNLGKKEIADTAFDASFSVSGFGSGMDVAASVYGGIIYYAKGKEIRVVTTEDLPIIVGNTGTKVKSGPVIKAVQYLEKKHPLLLTDFMDRIGDIVDDAERAIKKRDFVTLGELMNINHGLLSSIGVSSIELERLIFAARNSGALGAKLSGAGIGDNMFALSPDKQKDVSVAIKKAGGSIIPAKVGEGLRIEKSSAGG